MREHDMSQQIKEIRKHYGLSQQAFARLLGIGEASITRYEKGIVPTKANANLIRAAMIPEFMAGCLERDGDVLTPKQRASVEKIVCAEVAFDEEGDIMDMTEIYELTLQQEVLNEKSAWDTMAQIIPSARRREARGRQRRADDNLRRHAHATDRSSCTRTILSKSTAANQHTIDEHTRPAEQAFQQFLCDPACRRAA